MKKGAITIAATLVIIWLSASALAIMGGYAN